MNNQNNQNNNGNGNGNGNSNGHSHQELNLEPVKTHLIKNNDGDIHNQQKDSKKSKNSNNSKDLDETANDGKYYYNFKDCAECINFYNTHGLSGECPHCGSENYDRLCIPAVTKVGVPNNCVPSEFDATQAFNSCVGVSDFGTSCRVVHPVDQKSYQLEACKRDDGKQDYYCAFDESDSCTFNLCDLDDYYSYGPDSMCACEKVPKSVEILPEGKGRECRKGSNCIEYNPNKTKPSELLSDPRLVRFMKGYGSWLDVPPVDSEEAIIMANKMIA